MGTSSPPLHSSLLLLVALPLITISITTAASSAPLPLLALLSLKSTLHDPSGFLHSWTHTSAAGAAATHSPTPPWCAWPGVTCDAATTDITGLDLSRRNLSGTFSPTAAALLAPTLTSLNLSGNLFSGEFPSTVFLRQLRRLHTLDVSHNCFNGTLTFPIPAFPAASGVSALVVLDAYSNCFAGPLPRNLGGLTNLQRLNLGGSFFNGTIPSSISTLRYLTFLHLAGNALTGRIPPELGSLSSLEHLELGYNPYNDDAGVPATLGNLTRLQYLDIAGASLTGDLPPSLGSLLNLQTLFLFKNALTGSIPPRFSNLRSLQSLDLSDNRLTGSIPPSLLTDLTNLTTLNLMSNSLSGPIPPSLASLPNLEVLQLWNNSLTGPLPATLGTAASRGLLRVDVSSNDLTGAIPPELCAGGRLERLILFGNRFDSPIPATLAACASLRRVRLESNALSGEIPTGFGDLANLTYLDLSGNALTGGGGGGIPADLLASPSLQYLNVSGNPVGGALPNTAWQAPNMQVFAASGCDLAGELPAFGGCSNLYRLDLAGNELTGAIPADVSACRRLVSLRLQHNRLTGEIPAELAALPSITEIDLSWNDLSGVVPPGFANSTTLETFDVSFNHLVMAGGSPPSSRDAGEGGTAARRNAAMWVSAVVVAFAGMAVLAGTARWLRWREDGGGNGGGSARGRPNVVVVGKKWRMTAFQRLEFTADDVARCVEGSVVVGAGASGTVYRAKMPNGEVIAVKKLWRQQHKEEEGARKKAAADVGSRSTVAEVEVLGQLRHRNIVRLLGWCTDGDSEAAAAAATTLLLYEYMPNGSLDDLLHGGAATTGKAKMARLDWEARHRIAVGVAQGVSYLHHDCVPAVAHRDIKPCNILLDADMEPRVADFGVAKALLHRGGGGAPAMSVVAGSYGYIAPEYTYTLKVDEKSDVYSFGVVLLEILTSRRAVEAEYGEGYNIVDWVRCKVAAGGGGDVMDAVVTWAADELKQQTGGEAAVREEMALVLRVALLCTSRCPQERPSMRDVVSMLQEARRGGRKKEQAATNKD